MHLVTGAQVFIAASMLVVSHAQNINILCMMTKCLQQSVRCGASATCRSAVSCIGKCGTDMTCTYKCIATYGDKTFDLFIDCAMTKNKCIVPPANPHPIQCKKPPVDSLVKNFNITQLLGKWYVIYGMNPVFDCFNRSWSSFEKDGDQSLVLTEHYQVITLDGKPKNMSQRENFGYVDVKVSPSIFYLKSKDPGIARDDEFRIIAADPSGAYVAAYYCGESNGMRYEGGVVYSRTSTLTTSQKASLAQDLGKHGRDLKKLCQPIPAQQNLPKTIFN